MSDIHYFPRYSQQENVVTNNTLLLLLRFREFSRFKFEKLMEKICSDHDVQLASSWLRFQQQRTTGKSVVDGYITQDSVKIAVETKRFDSFNAAQLENHLAVFGSEQHKLLILLNPSSGANQTQLVASIRELATPRNIQIIHTSFQEIIEKARGCLSDHDEEMAALVDDYEAFCSDMDLLPADDYTLFVPPCGQSFEENKEFRLYYCPATWNRRNAKYLGIYKDKRVQAVGRIAKVVVCDIDLRTGEITPLNEHANELSEEERQRVIGASIKAEQRGWGINSGHKFYLCDTMEDTNFCKTTAGGIQGHRYFDLPKTLGRKVPASLAELADLLRQHTWP